MLNISWIILIYASLKMLETSWNPISANQGSTEETASAWWAWASRAASLATPRSSVKMQPKHKSMKSQKSFKSLQIEPKYVQIVCNNCRHRLCTFAGRIPGRCLNVIFLPNSTEGIYFLLTPLQAYNWKSLEKLKMHMNLWKKNNLQLLCSLRHCRRRGILQWKWFRCFRRWWKRCCSIVHVLWDIKGSDWHEMNKSYRTKVCWNRVK